MSRFDATRVFDKHQQHMISGVFLYGGSRPSGVCEGCGISWPCDAYRGAQAFMEALSQHYQEMETLREEIRQLHIEKAIDTLESLLIDYHLFKELDHPLADDLKTILLTVYQKMEGEREILHR